MSSPKDPFSKPLATADDDFAALDSLGTSEPMPEEASEATSLVDISALNLDAADDPQLVEDQRRAKEVGVSMASAMIEPLPENPRALLHFSDERDAQPVTKSVFVFGRSKEFADVVVTGDGVSRHHAALIFASGEFFIEDLNSTNGTMLAGKRVRRARLEPDVPVTIGSITFRLRWEY